MSRDNDPWYESSSPTRLTLGGLGLGSIVAIVLVIVALGISSLLWALGVFTSNIKGAGDQQKQINSANNRTFQYQHFFDLDATIRTQVTNEAQAVKDLASFAQQYPPSATETFSVTEQRNNLRSNASGLLQLCQSNVNQYNNDAQEFTRDKFLSSKLPTAFSAGVCTDPTLLPPAAAKN